MWGKATLNKRAVTLHVAFGNPPKVRFFPELDRGAGPEMGANPEVTGWVLPADWFNLGALVVFLRSGQYLKIGRS